MIFQLPLLTQLHIHFQKTKTIFIQKLEQPVIVLELLFNTSDMQTEV